MGDDDTPIPYLMGALDPETFDHAALLMGTSREQMRALAGRVLQEMRDRRRSAAEAEAAMVAAETSFNDLRNELQPAAPTVPAELLTLVGGPANGETIWWRGGDEYRHPMPARVTMSVDKHGVEAPRLDPAYATYRRRGTSANFDYVPPRTKMAELDWTRLANEMLNERKLAEIAAKPDIVSVLLLSFIHGHFDIDLTMLQSDWWDLHIAIRGLAQKGEIEIDTVFEYNRRRVVLTAIGRMRLKVELRKFHERKRDAEADTKALAAKQEEVRLAREQERKKSRRILDLD